MTFEKAPSLFQVKNSLGSLEGEIMKTIWQKKWTTVREIVNVFGKKRPRAYTTIMTVMDNLYKKGFLTRKKIKKSYYYFPIYKKNQAIEASLSRILKGLVVDYGRRKILFSAITASLPTLPKIQIMTTYKTPVGYGVSLTLFLSLLGFSAFDLWQNLDFFGAFHYLAILKSEPSLFVKHLSLIIFAFWENLPILNMLTTAVSFIFIIILTKKLFKLLDFKKPSFL